MESVNRKELLEILERVGVAVAFSETSEQTSSFVFSGGRVYAYNDQLGASCLVPITFEGAVSAANLLGVLRRINDETVKVGMGSGGAVLTVKGEGKAANYVRDERVLLPIESLVPRGLKWKALPPEFATVVTATADCASRVEDDGVLQFVHMTPEFLESSDNMQACRYTVAFPISDDLLVLGKSLRSVAAKVTEVGMKSGDSYIYFRDGELIYAVRLHMGAYPALDKWLKPVRNAKAIVMPAAMAEAVDRAAVVSASADVDVVRLDFSRSGAIRIGAENLLASYVETVEVPEWEPVDIKFGISPALLKAWLRREVRAYIAENRVLLQGASVKWVLSTDAP